MKPSFYFSQSIDERLWHVWRPVVKLGEYHNSLFFYVDAANEDQRELIIPPRGLYGKEFLALNPSDLFELMDFQRNWGPITGLRAQPNKTFESGTYPNVAINRAFYDIDSRVFHSDEIMDTVFLYEGYGKADIIAKERYGAPVETLGDVVTRNWRKLANQTIEDVDVVPCHIASVEEVSGAVRDAQLAIRSIAHVLSDGYTREAWEKDEPLVLECVRYCNAVLAGAVTPIDVIVEGNRNGVCTLMQYLFICLAKGVMYNDAYRYCQCPGCKQLFTPKEHNRRTDSKYCSPECQVKAKYYRQFHLATKDISEESHARPGQGFPGITWHA